jgi:hypothetical protein
MGAGSRVFACGGELSRTAWSVDGGEAYRSGRVGDAPRPLVEEVLCRLARVGRRLDAGRTLLPSGGSAGAELVVHHDGAAGGVVRDVRTRCLTLG